MPCYIVILRDDTQEDGTPGDYVLASRTTYANRALAEAARIGYNQDREPIIVELPMGHVLRAPERP